MPKGSGGLLSLDWSSRVFQCDKRNSSNTCIHLFTFPLAKTPSRTLLCFNFVGKRCRNICVHYWKTEVCANCNTYTTKYMKDHTGEQQRKISRYDCSSQVERFTIECRKIKTKTITYQSDYHFNQSTSNLIKTKTEIKVIAWLFSTLNWTQLHISITSSFLSPQFKYMIFHKFTCILCHLQIYYELTKWPAPSWPASSVGKALHPYRRGHGFESHSRLNFFQALFFTAIINQDFTYLTVDLEW